MSVGFGDGVPPVRVNTFDPATTLAAVLSGGRQPESVDIHRPGLDDLYRSLEGVTSRVA